MANCANATEKWALKCQALLLPCFFFLFIISSGSEWRALTLYRHKYRGTIVIARAIPAAYIKINVY